MKTYKANWTIKHQGTVFKPNTENHTLELNTKDATRLLNLGAISLVHADDITLPITNGADTGSSLQKTDELTQEQQLTAVVKAVSELDLTLAENTIGSGAPKADVLTEMVGFDVSAKMRDEAWVTVQAATNDANKNKEDNA